jgi:hypothetical protein
MCKANKRFFLYLLLAWLFVSVVGALRAEEPGPWYLISETELRSIEQYKETSEAEKRSWLSQVQGLKQDSANLNNQLAEARAQNRKLVTLFNEYAQDQLIHTSLKNGEIANLKQTVAEQTLETEKYKGIAWNRLFIIIALGAAWIIFIAFKVSRFFKIIKLE